MEFESPFSRLVVKDGTIQAATKENSQLREVSAINKVEFTTLTALAKEQDKHWKRHFNAMLPELLAAASHPLSSSVEVTLGNGETETVTCAPSRTPEKIQALSNNFKSVVELAAVLGLSKEQVGAAFHVAIASAATESGGAEVMQAAAEGMQQQCKQQ